MNDDERNDAVRQGQGDVVAEPAQSCVLDENVSFYANVRDASSKQTMRLGEYLEGIKAGRWESPVSRVRDAYEQQADKGSYQKLKQSILSCVTPAGVFDYHNKERLAQSSGVAVIDLDDPEREQDGACDRDL